MLNPLSLIPRALYFHGTISRNEFIQNETRLLARNCEYQIDVIQCIGNYAYSLRNFVDVIYTDDENFFTMTIYNEHTSRLKELKNKKLQNYDPTSVLTSCKNEAKKANGITTKDRLIVLYKKPDFNSEKKMTIAFLHELIHVLSSSNGLPDGFEYPETNLLEPTVQLVTKLYALKNPNIISTKDIENIIRSQQRSLR